MVRDQLLPALEILLGPGAGDALQAAVAAAGGRIVALSRQQVLYRPGEQASVRYLAEVRWGGAAPVPETLVAVTTVDGPPEGTLVVAAGELAVGIFRYPNDPGLPGLPIATSPTAVADRLGVGSPALELAVRTYRPGRRAVVRVRDESPAGGHVDRYLKVVPPAEAAELQDGLVELRRHLPVPLVAASWPELGIVALEALPGRTIREVLLAGGRADVARLPDGRAILGLLDRFPRPAPEAPRRRGPILRAAGHAGLLAAVLPAEAARLADLVGCLGDPPSGRPEAAVHGDLHEAQVLVEGAAIAGILDLDDTGRGHRVDDLATMLGHLQTLAVAIPARRDRIRRYAASLRPGFEAAVDPDELRRSTAAMILGLATGPFRVQQRAWRRRTLARIALAEAYLAHS